MVRWAAMRFLLEAYRRQRRRLQLEQLLLLTARCLLVALIGMAIARPYFAGSGVGASGARTVIVALDNSLASSVRDDDGGMALERLKAEARALVGSLNAGAGDVVGLIALGGPAQALVMPPSSDFAAVLRLIDELTPTDSAADVAGALLEVDALESVDSSRPISLVLLSEWLAGSVALDRSLRPLRRAVEVVGREVRTTGPMNVAVTHVEPPRSLLVRRGLGSADLSNPIRVLLRRSGNGIDEPSVTQVRARIEGASGDPVELGTAVVRWEMGQREAVATIAVRSSALASAGAMGLLSVGIDRDAIDGDNEWRVPVELRDAIRVGVVAPARFGRQVGVGRFEASDWVMLALVPTAESASGLEIFEVLPGAIDRPRLGSLDAVIVLRPDMVDTGSWVVLREVVDRGGLVVVSPPIEAQVHTWPDAMMSAFGLEWQIAREVRTLEPSVTLARPGASEASLLRVIAGELPYLVESVRVSKLLDVTVGLKPEGSSSLAGDRLESDPIVSGEVGLRTASGEPVLLIGVPEGSRGVVVLLSTALDPTWTDLPAKPLMVPLMQEVVRQGVARGSQGLMLVSGVQAPRPSGVVELVPVGVGPRVSLRDGAPTAVLRQAGVWRAVDVSGSPRVTVVANADHAGSDTSALSESAVADWLRGVTDSPVRLIAGRDVAGALAASGEAGETRGAGFAWMLLFAAAALAALEMFAARVASHAGVSVAPGGAA